MRAAKFLLAIVTASAAFSGAQAFAQQAQEIAILHKGQKFEPAEISVPANTAFTLKVKNADSKSIEFESKGMRVEKVVAAGSEAVIRVRPLKAGRYEFENEFHDATRGVAVAK